jgi:hypothetical protein
MAEIKITNKTIYNEAVEALITPEQIEEIKNKAVKYFTGFRPYEMPLRIFLEILEGTFKAEKIERDCKEGLTFFAKLYLDKIGEFAKEFCEKYEVLTHKPTAEERKAGEACLETNFRENILVFTRNYFGLHSFIKAYEITTGEILIAKKDNYNEVAFRRAMSKIELDKIKSKRK